jgi:hypothetical protein
MTDTNDDSGLWLSISEIARRKRVAPQTVHEKVKRLVDAGRLELRPGKGARKAGRPRRVRPGARRNDGPLGRAGRGDRPRRAARADRRGLGAGCSRSDVRGRVSTKWRQEPEAASILVYPFKSESECLHWERIFQDRFEASNGRLPRYCSLRGPGPRLHDVQFLNT